MVPQLFLVKDWIAIISMDMALGDRAFGGGGMVARLECSAGVTVINMDTVLGGRTFGGREMVEKLDS